MTDKELLKHAAKAAGIEFSYEHGCGDALVLTKPVGFQIYWNPLANDGDAFRLASRLRLEIRHNGEGSGNWLVVEYMPQSRFSVFEDFGCFEEHERDSFLRRAIVIVAAKVGKNMGDE